MTKRFQASLLLLVLVPLAPLTAQNINSDEMRSLDGQVQEIKSDVLSIAADLDAIEERLLYPSSTQLSVFVMIAEDENFRLDAVEVDVDGNLGTRHIYSFKELDALRNGGVQRLYTSNVETGQHDLNISMIGKLKNGRDFSESRNFSFSKGVEPKALGITLAGPGQGDGGIHVRDW